MRRIPARGILASSLAKMPESVFKLGAHLLAPMVPAGVNPQSLGRKLRYSGSLLRAQSADEIYQAYMTSWSNPAELTLMHEDYGRSRLENPANGSLMDKFMLDDQMDYLPNDILCKVDRASMAVGLETRIPALDPRVAEAAWRIPEAERWRDGCSKSIIREILYRYVPQAIVDRPKRGFSVPLERWLRGPLRSWADDLLSPATLQQQGILDVGCVTQKWKDFQIGGVVTAGQIWTLLMFQSWMSI
jgi:asparagine synthase (glutamine-hydrolysing)